jgi:hypothetical protein
MTSTVFLSRLAHSGFFEKDRILGRQSMGNVWPGRQTKPNAPEEKKEQKSDEQQKEEL